MKLKMPEPNKNLLQSNMRRKGGGKERQKYNASLFYPGSHSQGEEEKNVKKDMLANF